MLEDDVADIFRGASVGQNLAVWFSMMGVRCRVRVKLTAFRSDAKKQLEVRGFSRPNTPL